MTEHGTAPQTDLTILLLTLNEETAIENIIERVSHAASALGCAYELLVVDGGSTDRTTEIATAKGARVIIQRRFGYGGALIEGVKAARGEFIATLDVDGSHPPELLQSMWQERANADIVIGSRFIVGGKTGGPRYRQFLSTLLSKTYPRLLSLPARDVSSGYRLYRKSILQPEQYQCENFAVLLEILVLAYAAGYAIRELPLQYEPRAGGTSHARVLRFGLDYLSMGLRLWKLRNSVESADYDHRAFDSIIPLQRYWQRMRYQIITNFISGVEGQVLDIGCGTSRIIQGMPRSIACDFSFRKLRHLKKTNHLRVNASTFALPIGTKSVEGVIHSQVIEHIPYDPVIFYELNRVLKVGGTLVCGTPDYGRPWWPITEFFYKLILPNAYADEHITHYTKASLTAILAECGFRCLAYRYICGGELIIKARKIEDLASVPTPSVQPLRRDAR